MHFAAPLALLLQKDAGGAPYRLLDWQRMLFEDLPAHYAIEVFVRCAIIFSFAILALRLLGKRGTANLTPFEFAIILAFGTLVGDPSFYHDVGLAYAGAAMLSIVALYRAFTWLTHRHATFRDYVESHPTLLVQDGVIATDKLRRERLPEDDLFSMLRMKDIAQLGEVREAYLEDSGHLSVFRQPDNKVRAGLPIVPPPELRLNHVMPAESAVLEEGYHSCRQCGYTHFYRAGETLTRCFACSGARWVLSAPGTVGNVRPEDYREPGGSAVKNA